MAKQIKLIEAEIAALEQEVVAIAETLQSVYENYLDSLGQAVQQQLILACFHLCTQVYPQLFLRLPTRLREKLQTQLKQAGQDWSADLLTFVGLAEVTSEQTWERSLQETPLSETVRRQPGGEGLTVGFQLPVEGDGDLTLPPLPTLPASDPQVVMDWCEQVEGRLRLALKELSITVNRELYQAQVLPQEIPLHIVEVGVRAEESKAAGAGTPNLMTMVVETEKDERKEKIGKITAIRLRLAELEFQNAPLSRARQPIYQVAGGLGKMQKLYQGKQRERAIAQAEAAWRATWYDD